MKETNDEENCCSLAVVLCCVALFAGCSAAPSASSAPAETSKAARTSAAALLRHRLPQPGSEIRKGMEKLLMVPKQNWVTPILKLLGRRRPGRADLGVDAVHRPQPGRRCGAGVSEIQDLISQGVDAICNIRQRHLDSLTPVLRRAKEKGCRDRLGFSTRRVCCRPFTSRIRATNRVLQRRQ